MIKKKKVMSLFWAFALFLTILPLSEKKVYAATSGDWGYEVIDGTDEVAITEYKGNATSVEIPQNLGGKKVTRIASFAFHDAGNLTSITIPNTITIIEDQAFYRCSSLKNITIPNSVQRIGYSAFYGCSSLESITIPDGVKSIEMSTFYGCSGLKSIIIPDSVTNIVNSAFQDCTVVVYCSRGSYAEEYAKKKGLSVKYMSNQKVSVSTPSAFKQSSATTNNIKLTWKKGDGVSYEVYRSNKKNGSYKKIATVSTNSYTDKKLKAGTAYYYKVRAIKTVSKKTYKSSDSSILKAVTKPEKAKVTLKAGKKQIKISWKKVTGAEKQEVYLSTSKKGKYEKLTTTKKTKYTAKKLKKGKTYYITVRSYITNGSGKKYYSAYSSVKSVKVK